MHLRAVIVCDLHDSTALIERLGDRVAADLFARHDQAARGLIRAHHGREVDKTDGFLILFERPIQAVAFALDYQRQLVGLALETDQPLGARIGIHFGDVVVWANNATEIALGAKATETEGLAKPIAARLMALAAPGQILLSGVASTLARRHDHELQQGGRAIRWVGHGLYHFKGVSEPIAVYEVGEQGTAPFERPPNSLKGWHARAWWNHPVLFGTVATGFLVSAALFLYLAMQSEPALAFDERDWVVVGEIVNVNADKRLDPVLSSAFRIGLEQSRFVNVIPDIQVRHALLLMQRPVTTPLDRDLAAEIAIREQARAVVIPSVTQSGRALRLSAEIVDPQRGRTIWVRSFDADGPDTALKALDRLLRDLRSTLGESLGQIQSTTQPLEQVSTANLDALRTYSRALSLARQGDFEQAEIALTHATQLDPDFAAAYAFMGSTLYSQERWPEARAALEHALRIDGRLTERTRVYSRAILAHYTDPRSALAMWQMHANIFPDYATGQHNIGNVCYMFLLDYPCAELGFNKAALARNALLNYTLDTLGDVLVADDKPEEAATQYRRALALSPAPGLFGLASALMATERFDEAERHLSATAAQPAKIEVERQMRLATLFVARGRAEAAESTVTKAAALAARLSSPNPRWRARAALIALKFAEGDRAAAQRLAVAQLTELSAKAIDAGSDIGAIEELLYASAWAARLGLTTPARDALALARNVGDLERFPIRVQLALIAQAELDLPGDADGVLVRIELPRDAFQLWELHELRARAFRAVGNAAKEQDELRWLTTHTGLAQTQWTDQWLGQQARQWSLRAARARLADAVPGPSARSGDQ